jgi:homopolymeric O-antigen transport system permease protein
VPALARLELSPTRVMWLARVPAAAIRHRRLLLELTRRDIRQRFVGSRFGLLWTVINPLIQLAAYSAIFGFVYNASPDTPRLVFVATLYCGLSAWWAFQEGSLRGLTALVDLAPLLRKVPVPPEVCILASVLGAVLLQGLGFLLFLVVFAAVGGVAMTPNLLLLPVAAVLGLLLAASAGLALAPLHVVLRDTQHVVAALWTVLFFASPVLYRVDALPSALRGLAWMNPLTAVIGLYRSAVLGLPVEAAISFASCLTAIAVGWAVGTALLYRLDGILDEYL